jgi:hypothetical protein
MEKEHGCLLDAAGVAMWNLVERYTGNVGYRGGVKAEGLVAIPPVIDCSGWVSLLLSTGMKAVNDCGQEKFTTDDITRVFSWSDRIIQEIEARTGAILEGNQIAPEVLPRFATVGLRQGGGDWAKIIPGPAASLILCRSWDARLTVLHLYRNRRAGPNRPGSACYRLPIGSI